MERNAFNFYRSYYDVFLMLESDKDKVEFITALLKKQFENIDPMNMSTMAMFAYKSQEFNIKAQIEGFLNKIKTPTEGGGQGGGKGGGKGASVQEKEKGKVKEQVKEKEKEKVFAPPSLDEVDKFFKENGYTNADKAWNYYNDGDWKDSKGNPVVNWKQKMRMVWFKDENKPKIDEHEKIAAANRAKWQRERERFEQLNK
jgi:hypothetical protein